MARKIVLVLGLLVALLPYLGFPEALDTVLYSIAGLLIAFLAWSGKRPTHTTSIEEMEGELHEATKEEHAPLPTATEEPPQVSPEPVAEKVEVPASSPVSAEEIPSNDKMVSVSFTKHRSRNLKKRITQEDSSSTM